MDSVLGLVRHSGNDGLFKAIEMSLLATMSGQPFHLHAEGLRGTGKTTIMRAVRRALPRIRRIKGCLYNCDPAYPHCPQHRGLSAEEAGRLGDEWVPMPFLEISHSAKVGTVVGSVDLGRLVSPTQPEAALLPGTIPQAHRGIIFVDEINRLAETAPELADVLLDVMGTKPGRVQIEETGLPAVELPVQVSVWAASNPDEDPGPLEDIRRQLSDRFDFVVYTDRPGEAATVEQILAAAERPGWHRPLSPADEIQAELFRSRLTSLVGLLGGVQVPGGLRQQVAELYSRHNLESLRAVQAMQIGMRLAACLDERSEASAEDLASIAAMALRHRVDGDTLKKVSTHLAGLNTRDESPLAAAAVKGRFPTISFGTMTAEPLPAPVEAQDGPGAPGADKPAPVVREWATQHPPRPRQVSAEDAAPGWFHRALDGLRRNLGLGAQPGAGRAGAGAGPGSAARQSGSLRNQGSAAQRTQLPPRPGSLFQRAEALQKSGLAELGENGPPASVSGSGRPDQRRQAREGQAQVHRPDPLAAEHLAPPNPARPLSSLADHEFIRTEEELGRR